MSTLIDALKGLLESDYARRANGAYWKTELTRIIAEHERSAEQSNHFQPSDLHIREMLVDVSDKAKELHDQYSLPIWSDVVAFDDPAGLVDIARSHMSRWSK